jgi:hypothetical protein
MNFFEAVEKRIYKLCKPTWDQHTYVELIPAGRDGYNAIVTLHGKIKDQNGNVTDYEERILCANIGEQDTDWQPWVNSNPRVGDDLRKNIDMLRLDWGELHCSIWLKQGEWEKELPCSHLHVELTQSADKSRIGFTMFCDALHDVCFCSTCGFKEETVCK